MLNISTLPPRVRQVIYYVFAIAGIAFGATEIAIGDPHWLTVALTVLSFVGSSIGVTAGVHTPVGKSPETASIDVSAQTVTVDTGDAQDSLQGPAGDTVKDAAPKRAATDPMPAEVPVDPGEDIDIDSLPEPE